MINHSREEIHPGFDTVGIHSQKSKISVLGVLHESDKQLTHHNFRMRYVCRPSKYNDTDKEIRLR